MPESKVEIEVAVLQTKMDHIEESVHELKDQVEQVEVRVMRIEKVTYMLLGGLVFLQMVPLVRDLLTAV
jgi:hypothetical protein